MTYNENMNLGRSGLIFLCLFLLIDKATSQSSGFGSDLNTILEDKERPKASKTSIPQYDEEFKAGEITEEKKLEEEMNGANDLEKNVNKELFPEEEQDSSQAESQNRKELPLNEAPAESVKDLKNKDEVSGQEYMAEPEDLNFEVTPQEKNALESNPPTEDGTTKASETSEDMKVEGIIKERGEPAVDVESEPEGLQTEQELPEAVEKKDVENIETQADADIAEENDVEEKPIKKEIVIEPQKKEKIYSKTELEKISEETSVEIEDTDFLAGEISKNKSDILKSFNQRRPEWTAKVELMYSQYEPLNYTSEIVPTTFAEYYDSADVPLSGFSVETKRNFSFGAIALGAGLSYYSAEAALDDADLSLLAPSIKTALYLDKIFKEPYVVPYASAGYTYFMYKENYEDASEILEVSGETDNFFVSLGLELQLDWLDAAADISSYSSGLENSFFFLEARMYLDQGIVRTEQDPDFSTDFYLALGMRLEF